MITIEEPKKVDTIDEDYLMQIGSAYSYALIYEMSHVYFGETAQLTGKINSAELQEAYYFGEDGQTHIFQNDDGWNVVCMTKPQNAEYIDHAYFVDGQFASAGKNVIIREYLAMDEDGQARVEYTQLVRIEK